LDLVKHSIDQSISNYKNKYFLLTVRQQNAANVRSSAVTPVFYALI